MKIAIASGKGGTGKTTIATNLAVVLAKQGRTVELLDCDVEEPNCHIFIKPKAESIRPVYKLVPEINVDKCNGCGICAEVCQFSAIICVNEKVLVFPELCHGCGGCTMFCPETAIVEKNCEIGKIESSQVNGIRFIQGRLHVGQSHSSLLIHEVKALLSKNSISVIDAPPGTSCPVIKTIEDVDMVVLVTEPTPFGLHDLKLAVETVRVLNLPFGVAINRCNTGDDKVRKYCEEEEIEILLEIPDDRRIAVLYSRGGIAVDTLPEYEPYFINLFEKVTASLANAKITGCSNSFSTQNVSIKAGGYHAYDYPILRQLAHVW